MASFNKKVSIDKNVDVILIPTKDEIEENTIDNIWYNDAQLEKIKNEAICEIRVYSMIKNISFKQASKDIYAIE